MIDEVKRVSGIPEDGDSNFNSLATDAERDEQRGIMNLFKGLVGLRNSKAHSNLLFDDPLRAHVYLALASLLMWLLEIAQVNKTP